VEVQDHIRKLWKNQAELLDLMFGKYEAESPDEPVKVHTLGPQMFFLNNIVVPPTRFRPESEGAAGQSRGGDKAYLHTHSVMLLRILSSNQALKDALLD